jgi:hypothetical protein
MATDQQASEIKVTTPSRPPRRKPPKVPLFTSRMVAILILLVIIILGTFIFGEKHPDSTSTTFGAQQTPTQQSQPTPSAPPECPALRPDPTFGISIIDIQTEQPLCERNPNGIAQPASTTKIMSALLVEEYLQINTLSLDTPIIAQAVDKQVEWDAAVAYLQVGQPYSVRLLLYMVSINSAADATMALARFVAGSRAAFLNQMNQRAQALGMTHTHFTSPYGYATTSPDNWQQGEDTSVGNYSSAHDLARLMLEFARYPDLVTIFGATEYHEGNYWLYRSIGHTITDSWTGLRAPDTPSLNAVKDLHLPFQVLAVKKGCMWCSGSKIHKYSYVLLARFQQQVVAAAFLYTTQDYFNPLVGDMLPVLLWVFHQCDQPAYTMYCYPPPPTPTPAPSPTP